MKMKCDICSAEIEGTYHLLYLSYKVQEAPPKKSPFREEMKTSGGGFFTGDIFTGSLYKELGIETFVEDAKVCNNCQNTVDELLDALKLIFHPLQGSAKNG